MPAWFSMLASLLSAIFLFLFGLHFLGEGLKNATQDKLKAFFNKAIKNRVVGALFGVLITGIIQSSTAVTVMTIGFVNAGLMTLLQAASIIVGANVGTTFTSYMMTISFGIFITPLMIMGGLLFLFAKKDKIKEIGKIFFGVALFFQGLTAMSDTMRPLRDSEFFREIIVMLEGQILLGILAGAIITAIVQSSTASKAIVISMAGIGAINLNVAIPIIFGLNIGTCLTAILSSINANKNAKRIALFHLLFSIIGTIIFLPFINVFTDLVVWIGGDTDFQVANAHTIFNVITAILILPFIGPILKLICVMVKDDEASEEINRLDERFLNNPAIALEQAFQESLTMYDLAIGNLEIAADTLLKGKTDKLKLLYQNEDTLNQLECDISDFLSSLASRHMHEVDTNRIASMIRVIGDIERIGDHGKNIAALAQEAKDSDAHFTSEAMKELELMLIQTLKTVKASYESYEYNDLKKATDTIAYEQRIDFLEDLLRDKHIERLSQRICSARNGAIFLDAISNFERIGDHSVNIAESILKAAKTTG